MPATPIFLSTLPARGATRTRCTRFLSLASFLSTLPARGATARRGHSPRRWRHFYPRSPRGERRRSACIRRRWNHFYPRSPRGERRSVKGGHLLRFGFLSTLPARGATQAGVEGVDGIAISIHAPREGSDADRAAQAAADAISIHAPREGSDMTAQPRARHTRSFLSTLPARGATSCHRCGQHPDKYFYPRSPRGERLIP